MFLSLLKIVSLTVISSLSFGVGIESDKTDSLPISEGEITVNQNIKKSYISYDESNNYYYFNLDVADLSFYDYFLMTLTDGQEYGNFYISVNYVDGSSGTFSTFTSVKTYSLGNGAKFEFHVDWSPNYKIVVSRGDIYWTDGISTKSILNISIEKNTTNFYDDITTYLYENTEIILSKDYLNTISFNNFAYSVINNESKINYIMKAIYDNETMLGELNTDSLVFNETYNILFSFNESQYYGYWFLNNNIEMFDYDLFIQVGNISLWNELKNSLSLDYGNHNSLDFIESFNFEYYINYNAPYQRTSGDIFIQDNYFTNVYNDSPLINKDYTLPYFVSNGEIYNRVRFQYVNGYGTRYLDSSSGEYKVLNVSGFGYFNSISYINDDINNEVLVSYRNFGQYTDSNSNIQGYLNQGMTWVNVNYRNLYFLSELTSSQKNNLTQFNSSESINGFNGGGIGGGTTVTSTDALDNSFSLISRTLNNMVGFFGIMILPGISLGALILIPFAITMLLFVVKLFKR